MMNVGIGLRIDLLVVPVGGRSPNAVGDRAGSVFSVGNCYVFFLDVRLLPLNFI